MPIIPPSAWATHHFSAIVYAWVCAEIHNNRLNPTSMRRDGQRYPTITREGAIAGHDDLACLRDAEAAGVLRFTYPYAFFTPEGSKLGAWLLSVWDEPDFDRGALTWAEALGKSGAQLGEAPR